jgi:hypothetical protein
MMSEFDSLMVASPAPFPASVAMHDVRGVPASLRCLCVRPCNGGCLAASSLTCAARGWAFLLSCWRNKNANIGGRFRAKMPESARGYWCLPNSLRCVRLGLSGSASRMGVANVCGSVARVSALPHSAVIDVVFLSISILYFFWQKLALRRLANFSQAFASGRFEATLEGRCNNKNY